MASVSSIIQKTIDIAYTPMRVEILLDNSLPHKSSTIAITISGLKNLELEEIVPAEELEKTGRYFFDPRYAPAAEYLIKELDAYAETSETLRKSEDPVSGYKKQILALPDAFRLLIDYPFDELRHGDPALSEQLFENLNRKASELIHGE